MSPRSSATKAIVLPADDASLVARLGTADDPLTDDALTGRVRILQRKRGHRYSLDDVLTAFVAIRESSSVSRHVDLGCGVGSVLLMVADRLGDATHLGVEAQQVSFDLARRNVERNGLGGRIALAHGDLRGLTERADLEGTFDLVTGTPPYIPPGSSTPAPDPQKAYARIEYRGGVEDYLRTARHLVARRGRVVVCFEARAIERSERAGAENGLSRLVRIDAIPREGAPALFAIHVFGRAEDGAPSDRVERFVARDRQGRRSRDYLALRAFFDLPAEYDPHAEDVG